MRRLWRLRASSPILAGLLVFAAGGRAVPAMSPPTVGGAPNATFATPASAADPVPGWSVQGEDEFARFAIEMDGDSDVPAFAAWPLYAGWPSRVTLLSSPFELSAACSRLTFAARAVAPGDAIEIELLAEAGNRFLGRYALGDDWQAVTLPDVGDFAGQELQLDATVFAWNQVQIRALGSSACPSRP